MTKDRVNLFNVFKTIIWPQRVYLGIGLVLIMFNRVAGLVLPYSSKILLDEIIPKADLDKLWWMLSIVMGAITIQAISSFLLTRILGIQAQYLIAQLRIKVQKKIISLPIKYFDNHKSGELVSRIMTDVEGVRNLVGSGLVQLFGGTITGIASFIILININAWMTIFVLVPIILFAAIAMKAFSYIRPIFRKRSKIRAQVTGRLTETLGGIRVIKGFNAESSEVSAFEKGVIELFDNIKKSMTSQAFVTSSSTFLLGIASVGIMGIGGNFIIKGEMTPGDFIAFTLYLGFMIAPIVQMSNIGTQLTEAFAGLDRTEEIMSEDEEDNESRTKEITHLEGNIEFRNVSFSYENDKEVIHDISFDAHRGSVTALVGSSGSGKSTIAGLAASFLNAKSGKVIVDGIDLSKTKLDSYRKNLAVVLQDDFLFEGTIRENIIFPRPNSSEEEIQAAIKGAYVNEFTDRFDDGLDTLIGERGVKLSGGQKQRISIARAILANPKIIILDEATSSLDTESESFIQKSLAELMKGKTTFVIAHRLSTIKQADQILVIEEGNIVERGKHQELIDKEGRYFELFTYQSRI